MTIELDLGTNSSTAVIVCWVARMGASCVVLDLKDSYRYSGGTTDQEMGPGPWNPLDGICLQ